MKETSSPESLRPRRRVLANGVTCLLQQTTTHPAVTIAVVLAAGTVHEPADRTGLAHFVSRVIDRGTRARSTSAIAEALDDRGVSLATGVSRHRLFLSCSCLAEDASPILQLVADIVRDPVFPPREVETRRTEIITSIRQDADHPAVVAGDALATLLFGAHPYGRPVKGSVDTVQSVAREDLVAFHQARVAPAVTTVAVVGDIDVGAAGELVDQAFGDWMGPPVESGVDRVPAAPHSTHRQRHVVPMMEKPQAEIACGFPALRRHDPRYYAAVLMNNVLGQYGLGGRLGDSIRERQGLAYYAYSSLDADIAGGLLTIRAGVAGRDVDRTVESIDEEVARMLRDGVMPAELSDARRYLIGSLPRMLETNDGIASFLLTAEHFGLGLEHDRRLPDLLEAVTLDDVNAVAAGLLRTEGMALAIAGPYADRGAGLAA